MRGKQGAQQAGTCWLCLLHQGGWDAGYRTGMQAELPAWQLHTCVLGPPTHTHTCMSPMLAGSSTRALPDSTSRCSCTQPRGDSGSCDSLHNVAEQKQVGGARATPGRAAAAVLVVSGRAYRRSVELHAPSCCTVLLISVVHVSCLHRLAGREWGRDCALTCCCWRPGCARRG